MQHDLMCKLYILNETWEGTVTVQYGQIKIKGGQIKTKTQSDNLNGYKAVVLPELLGKKHDKLVN